MGKYLGEAASVMYNQPGGKGEIQSFTPRSKFQFDVTIDTIIGTYSSIETPGSSKARLRLSSVTLPTFSSRVQTLNQYNKKRIVQTGVDYNPIEMSVYDTRDGQIEQFLKSYAYYYYHGSPMNGTTSSYGDDITGLNFSGIGDQSNVGFRLTPDRNFIKEISIIRRSSKEDTSVSHIINPVVTGVTIDPLDYSDSGLVQYRISFAYESYNTYSGKDGFSNMNDLGM